MSFVIIFNKIKSKRSFPKLQIVPFLDYDAISMVGKKIILKEKNNFKII